MTEWQRANLADFSKLNIREGRIHYKIYQQDGRFQPMSCADTRSNRLFVAWVQVHDRYTTEPPK